MAKVEFIQYLSVRDAKTIPFHGMVVESYAGEDEPKIKSVVVEMERLDEKGRYKFRLSTSDPRMGDLEKRCDHDLVAGTAVVKGQ